MNFVAIASATAKAKQLPEFYPNLVGRTCGALMTRLVQPMNHKLDHHGGADKILYKSNYLSVRNYLFQVTGLRMDGAQGHFDFSSRRSSSMSMPLMEAKASAKVRDWMTTTDY